MEIALVFRTILVALCSLFLLAACGHVEELRSARQEQATDLNQRAQHAFQRGEYQVAAALYENALQLDVAIENVNGIAVNALSLAKVNQMLGKPVLAERYLDSLLVDKALHYAPAQLAAAAIQKSLLRLQQNDESGATKWVDKAAEYCAADCAIAGVIDNARANIALHASDAEKALHWSEQALSENRNSSQLEYANSLRLSASARIMKGDHDTALRLLVEALGIDKSLGLPEKIRQDLLLLAQAHEKLGQAEQAAQFRDRAARIAAATAK
jgi:tetratricopeptide (TPR) repeat protein